MIIVCVSVSGEKINAKGTKDSALPFNSEQALWFHIQAYNFNEPIETYGKSLASPEDQSHSMF